MKYYTINKFAKIIGVTPQTLRNWDRSGRLHPHHTSTNGYRYYSEEQLCAVTGIQFAPRKVIGYCRVSSRKQKDDLERQVENLRTYLYAQGNPFEIITDIGSGINYKKDGLQELIHRIEANQVEKVVVLYKDRLVRFGFELLETIATIHGCKIEIVDMARKSEQQELVEDLVQIITVFGCKLQGKRAHQAKKMIRELAEDDSDDKVNPSTAVAEQQTED
ncbi:IS607 family transposase [uncultured Mitsuokella sp.]|uniref:IS607 family transposase n=1 Tax=uncultured Mitsuokella sp. TaxID=453120 RepID=UPI00260C6F54|nr:IS607 family transposase [uncultured Mitsuokella sp.]